MSFGFRLEGDHGEIMIDERYPVYQVVSEYSPAPGPYFGTIIGSPIAGQMCIAIPPATGQTWLNGSLWYPGIDAYDRLPSWRDYSQFDGTPSAGYPGVSYGWRVAFAQAQPVASPEKYGMRVFGPAGERVYDSGYPLVYFAGFGGSFAYSHKVMTRNDNDLESFIFVYRVPIPPVPAGMRLGLLADTLTFVDAWTASFQGGDVYYGFPYNSRTHLYVGIQGPSGFSSRSQAAGSIEGFLQSIVFTFL